MTTLRTPHGVAVRRAERGKLLVVDGQGLPVTVLRDPDGAPGGIIRKCVARDRGREEEKRRCR